MLDVVITAVNYNDYLALTLKHNVYIFDNIHVITSPNDKQCQDLCKLFSVNCIVTDSFYQNGDTFNKGRAINTAIQQLPNPNWILSLDGDIIVTDTFSCDQLNVNCLYSTYRIIVPEYQDYLRVVEGDDEYLLKERFVGWGYFQLFNINAKHLNRHAPYPENYKDAGGYDFAFLRKYKKATNLKIKTYHLGPTKQNWKARVTKRFCE